MSAISISPVCPARIQPHTLLARNGMLVGAELQAKTASLVNVIARYRSKEYAALGGDYTAATANKTWRFAGSTGPMASAIVARVFMGLAPQVTATNNPRIQLSLTDTSGNAITSGSAFFGSNYGNTPNKTPDENGLTTIALAIPAAYRNTRFRAQLAASEEAHAISCTVYELALSPDTTNGYVNSTFSVGQSILDVDRSSIQTLAHSLYKYNGPSLFNYSSQTDATPASTVGFLGDYANIIDNAGTAYRTGGVPLIVDLRSSARKTVLTVPVMIEVYAAKPVGAAGSLRIVDDAGNTYATFGIATAASWQSAAANFPADKRRYYIEAVGDGINPVLTYAVSCYRRS